MASETKRYGRLSTEAYDRLSDKELCKELALHGNPSERRLVMIIRDMQATIQDLSDQLDEALENQNWD